MCDKKKVTCHRRPPLSRQVSSVDGENRLDYLVAGDREKNNCFFSTSQVAKMKGITKQAVIDSIYLGKYDAIQIGHDWRIFFLDKDGSLFYHNDDIRRRRHVR